MAERTESTVLVCRGCDRELEACAFCLAEGCPDPICYRCVTHDLGQTSRQPHEHGG